MIVSEKGCVAALKKAFEKGYEIIPSGSKIAIYTENWALETDTRELPLAVSKLIVEHYDGIPVQPMAVRKGREKQTMFGGMIRDREQDMQDRQENPTNMFRVPVTFRDKWDMFVKDTGEWMCIDRQYLDILEIARQPAVMMTDEGMALFALADEKLTVAPGRFGTEDTVKLQKIAEMYMKPGIHELVLPENLSLFDDLSEEDE